VQVNDILIEIEKDMIGFAGCNKLGRTYGYSQFSEITQIKDEVAKKEIQEKIIYFAEKMICEKINFKELILNIKIS